MTGSQRSGRRPIRHRDVAAWQRHLAAHGKAPDKGYASTTVNNHLAALSGFCSWVHAQDPTVFAVGNPAVGVKALPVPALRPRCLSDDQLRSLRSVCDRLEYLYRARRQPAGGQMPPLHARARPLRDRAIVHVLLSTGLRRAELVGLDIEQLIPSRPTELRLARRARLEEVRGKGQTSRLVWLSADARRAVADYLDGERPDDATPTARALFLAAPAASRGPDARLSTRALNKILSRIGGLHDGEQADPERYISPLRPHDLRHTFAYQLAKATGADRFELERRLGHQSARYIGRYTEPPETVSAGYVEDL